jgi:hypothetical protein
MLKQHDFSVDQSHISCKSSPTNEQSETSSIFNEQETTSNTSESWEQQVPSEPLTVEVLFQFVFWFVCLPFTCSYQGAKFLFSMWVWPIKKVLYASNPAL